MAMSMADYHKNEVIGLELVSIREEVLMVESKVVIVTGASSGLGAAIACWLGKIGASVVLVARNEDRLKRTSDQIARLGGRSLIVSTDVGDPDACREVVHTTLEQYQRIDALVNNAGIITPLSSIAKADINQWRTAFDVNLLGPFYLTHFALASLTSVHGRIVNISSGAANIPLPAASAYCASKAALTHFTRVLAEEVTEITAVSIRPGVVDTPMQDQIRREGPAAMKPEQVAYYQNLKTHGQLEPSEVPARSIAWLALYAPHKLSGNFINYDDPDIAGPAFNTFGTALK